MDEPEDVLGVVGYLKENGAVRQGESLSDFRRNLREALLKLPENSAPANPHSSKLKHRASKKSPFYWPPLETRRANRM